MHSNTQYKQISKHIMFSYQRKSEEFVSKIFFHLKQIQSIPIWMDQYGGVNQCLTTSLAEGVENCSVLVCFLTPEYQDSLYCKKELTYAAQLRKPIIPCILTSQDNTLHWKPTQWLGFTITDLLYLDFTDLNDQNFEIKCQQLINKINSVIGIKRSLSPQPSNTTEQQKEDSDDEDIQRSSPLIIPPTIREGPQINNEVSAINPKKYSSEGDSFIHLLNQSSEIECNQDLYANNGRFFNYFTLSRIIFHNTSSQPISILQLSGEYINNSDGSNKWIPCQIKTNEKEDITKIDSNELVVCSITIKIEIYGTPGVDNQRRSRAHRSLPQPLKLKINIEDTQMKHSSLIIEQINRPLNLPTLDKLTTKLNVAESNILGFVWADNCSIDTRYFALISYSDDDQPFVKFSFGCDVFSLRSPSWDKQFIKNLQKTAKKQGKHELIVHEGVFDPFVNCVALFDEHFRLQGITIKIKTDTSVTIQTIPLPIEQIFSQSEYF